MNYTKQLWILLWLALVVNGASAESVSNQRRDALGTNILNSTNRFIGWSTNGASIFQNYRVAREWKSPFPTNYPGSATNPWLMRMRAAYSTFTNHVFTGFVPESLNHLVWTNFIAHTNGRDLNIWLQRTHPVGWPGIAPIIKWNTNSLIWGLKGWTALSPCWEGEGSSGQVPVTLLTRRHGYTRGHGMGPEGFNTRRVGSKVWFLAPDNLLVTRTIRREVVRAGQQGDYTIFIFDHDLPDTIQPVRVTTRDEAQTRYVSSSLSGGICPIFKTEQHGQVSAEVPGLGLTTVDTFKPGDSGSPDLLPLPGELVFFGGRSTSGPSSAMQADLDALSKMEGLDPSRYQLRWVDLSKYPAY